LETCWLNFITDWEIPPAVTGTLVVVGFIYARGWLALRRTRPKQIPKWRLFSFLAGLFAIFLAVSSSLDTYSETLLFMHMAQHFVLMSMAPPLIVLGCPFVPLLRGLPRPIIHWIGGPLFRSSVAHSGTLFPTTDCVAGDEPHLCGLAYSECLRIRFILGKMAQLRTLLFFRNEPHLLVAHRAALADTTPIELVDDHSVPLDVGFRNHWLIGIPVFFRAVALPELWNCRTTLRNRRVEEPDRGRSLHVGIGVVGVSSSRDLSDYSIAGERPTRERENGTR
jgi:hypothetical protein